MGRSEQDEPGPKQRCSNLEGRPELSSSFRWQEPCKSTCSRHNPHTKIMRTFNLNKTWSDSELNITWLFPDSSTQQTQTFFEKNSAHERGLFCILGQDPHYAISSKVQFSWGWEGGGDSWRAYRIGRQDAIREAGKDKQMARASNHPCPHSQALFEHCPTEYVSHISNFKFSSSHIHKSKSKSDINFNGIL